MAREMSNDGRVLRQAQASRCCVLQRFEESPEARELGLIDVPATLEDVCNSYNNTKSDQPNHQSQHSDESMLDVWLDYWRKADL